MFQRRNESKSVLFFPKSGLIFLREGTKTSTGQYNALLNQSTSFLSEQNRTVKYDAKIRTHQKFTCDFALHSTPPIQFQNIIP